MDCAFEAGEPRCHRIPGLRLDGDLSNALSYVVVFSSRNLTSAALCHCQYHFQACLTAHCATLASVWRSCTARNKEKKDT